MGIVERRGCLIVRSERIQCVIQGASDQKFHGHVINAPRFVFAIFQLRFDPTGG